MEPAVHTVYIVYAQLEMEGKRVSFAAFQLDGVSIGVTRTRTRAMRDAAVVSPLLFLGASWLLVQWQGNHGLWAACGRSRWRLRGSIGGEA